jgi:hypothetical protein
MTESTDFQVGDCVRLTCDLPVGAAGTEGVIIAIHRDDHQEITTLTIFVSGDTTNTYGTAVFPREVKLVRRGGATDGYGSS